ncbi:MAG: glycosyltransferase family 2 protein [Acidimicrobiales bacterium]
MSDPVGPPQLAGDGAGVAVLIPCLNEESTVARVVAGFRHALPEAGIFVYDNGSTDKTAAVAERAGAVVRREPRPGKGNVIRRMFADVDAEVYLLVDGDDTYDPALAPSMVQMLVDHQLDMVVACRRPDVDDDHAFPRGHTAGNVLFSKGIRMLFGGHFTDVFSGYRALSRRLVKSLPVHAKGFEIETELTAHAVQLQAACAEVDGTYRSRVDGSDSKLRTWHDGFRILGVSLRLFKEMHPARFFGVFFLLLTVAALALGLPVVDTYVHTGLVPRFPTAILAAALQIVAFICLTCGLILDSVARGRAEMRRLAYLQIGHSQLP